MKRLLLLVGAIIPALGSPCFNDRDTLGFELYNAPDVQKALTGRFDRYPPLYYTMRVDRLRAKSSISAVEYDDIAVALGRIGRNDEALAALAQKARLPGLSMIDQYRLYANRGTIEAHKFIQQGGDLKDIQLLKKAESDIAYALKLNPNAHFGREGTQLEVLRWLEDLKTHANVKRKAEDISTLGEWLADKLNKEGDRKAVEISKTLAGLIMLGGAWESPDAALAIAELEVSHMRLATARFGLERYRELIKGGKKSLAPELANNALDNVVGLTEGTTQGSEPSTIQRFHDLRKEAEDWHKAKTEYMLSRLKLGSHPDTDRNFWSGWKEPQMPEITRKLPKKADSPSVLIVVGVISLSLAAILVIWRRLVHNRR